MVDDRASFRDLSPRKGRPEEKTLRNTPYLRSLTWQEHAIIVKSRHSSDAVSANRGLRALAQKDRFHIAVTVRFITLTIISRISGLF